MRHLPRIALVVLPLLLCGSLGGCAMDHSTPLATRQVILSEPADRSASLSVTTQNGSIVLVVEPDRPDITVEAILACSGSSPAEARDRGERAGHCG